MCFVRGDVTFVRFFDCSILDFCNNIRHADSARCEHDRARHYRVAASLMCEKRREPSWAGPVESIFEVAFFARDGGLVEWDSSTVVKDGRIVYYKWYYTPESYNVRVWH